LAAAPLREKMRAMNRPARIALAHLPTPLQPLPRLSKALGVQLSVKRDDLTGSHLSGNKIRKLEYLLADAVAGRATHVVTCGGVQSNHCRATALAAAPLGMQAELLLRTPNGLRTELPDPPVGNVYLDRLVGATIHPTDPLGYQSRDDFMRDIADGVRDKDGVPYVVPEGGSNALGALGYVDAADELLAQLDSPPDTVVVATGSGGTLAGLALGFEARGVPTRALGFAVCDDRAYFRGVVDRIADDARRYGLPALSAERYDVIDGFVGRGYGLATDDELAFLADVARRDGLVLDPVYTNKAFRGLVTLLREDPTRFGRHVVFIHTGGIFGLLGHGDALDAARQT